MRVLGQRHGQDTLGVAGRNAVGINFVVELELPLEGLQPVLLARPTRSCRIFILRTPAGDGQHLALYLDLKVGAVAPRRGEAYFVAVFQFFYINGRPESVASVTLRPVASMVSRSFGGISAASVHSMMMFVTHDSIGFGGAEWIPCAHFEK